FGSGLRYAGWMPRRRFLNGPPAKSSYRSLVPGTNFRSFAKIDSCLKERGRAGGGRDLRLKALLLWILSGFWFRWLSPWRNQISGYCRSRHMKPIMFLLGTSNWMALSKPFVLQDSKSLIRRIRQELLQK